MSNWQRTFDPSARIRDLSTTSGSRTASESGCRLCKSQQLLVRSRARMAAFSASWMELQDLRLEIGLEPRKREVPITTVSRLLKSWAMPPARSPSDSSLLAR